MRNAFRDDVDDNYVFAVLVSSSQSTYAYCECKDGKDAQETAEKLKSYIGCQVKIKGQIASMSLETARRHLRQAINFSPSNGITVLSRPTTDPFDAPSLAGKPPELSEIDTCGKRRVSGVVLARWRGNRFLIQAENGEANRILLRDSPPPKVGECVECVGEVATDLYNYNIFDAQWRPAKKKIDFSATTTVLRLKDFFTFDGRMIIATSIHGKTIRTIGTLKSVLTDENGFQRLLIGDGAYKIIVDCSAVPDAVKSLREGCELEVTGIGVIERENWHPNLVFPHVTSVFLVPRATADIKTLRQPPWWTPARLTTVLVSLLILIAIILVWNASLRILVVRKSRALLKEQALKLSETLKVDERTRLAAELHDFHSQNLTAIAYRISAAKNACTNPQSETAQNLSIASRMLKSCRTELRRCLWDLRNDALDEPDFAFAIRKTVQPISGNIQVSVRFSGRRTAISDSTAHGILSTLRELTANAINHGHATDIRIAGEARSDGIRFSVRDNGCGFDPTTRLGQDNGHFGLDGIKERLDRFGGSITIKSAPGHGTYIRLTIAPPQQILS